MHKHTALCVCVCERERERERERMHDVARDSSLILFHAFIPDIHCINTTGSVSYYSPSLYSKTQ